MDQPFGNLEPAPGMVLASAPYSGRYSLWRIETVMLDNRLFLVCPFGKSSPVTGEYRPDKGEWLAPNIEATVAYLRLVGKEFV